MPVGIGVVIVAVIAVAAIIMMGSRGGSNEGSPRTADGSLPAQAAAVPTPPTATPVAASAVRDTPIVERVVAVAPVGHRLIVAGYSVEPGQDAIGIPNGTVFLSEPPGADGIYRDDLEVTLKVRPDQPGSEVIWSGVDFHSDTVAGITMINDRFVNVEILLPDIPPVRETEDDHGDSLGTATDISFGSFPGVIGSSFDQDVFRFFAEAGASYVIEVFLESHPNTVLVLLDRFGHVVEENDDGEGLHGGSRIIWTAQSTSGEYFLVVSSFDPELDAGSYTLSLTFISDDHGDSIDSATFISPGSIFGTIDPPSDVDLFGFFARAGESYIFEVVLEDHPDTVLSLYQWHGIQLDEVDDTEGMDGGSRISWTAPEDGDYFLEVRSYDPDSRPAATLFTST